MDKLTKQALHHTFHCLIGCGIGEITGMLISSAFGWHRLARMPLALLLAFVFGYSLTYIGVRQEAGSFKAAMKLTLGIDTVSILSMEIIDNIIEFIIPNALVVNDSQIRFWWGLALALTIAFIFTVPVNRYLMSKDNSHHH
ncbi:MAG TPA: DUF4396 domain-containing protein [Candidatus Saccharimonadales bacterium]|nr:DUF4396 domain-containing protein [Candidatus Saccharimonadales bacterium]